LAAHGTTSAARLRRRRTGARATQVRFAVAVLGFVAIVLLLGFAFAGSPTRLAEGTRIAGIDVGGLSPGDARALLERRARRLARVPVVFTAGTRTWRIRPEQLGVKVDWGAAVDAAQREGGGFGPVRGYRRLELRFFSGNFEPPTRAYEAALTYELARIARGVNAPHREARLVRRGLQFHIVPAQTGRRLARAAAARVLVRALASFDRAPVGLPVRTDPPTVTRADLAPALAQARRAVSAPVTLTIGAGSIFVPRWRIATMLVLPHDGTANLRLGGSAADAYFAHLERSVDKPARDAGFAVYANGVRIVPARAGTMLDVPRTAARLLSAALRPTNRTAPLVIGRAQPHRSTAEARAMGITGVVGAYETVYGGDPNRVHNVQLVAHLVDGKLIAPGATFSFNQATGARTAEKGFREAPVIINGELQTGLGGGVCQVSTTVFNAAYDAGLPITARTNHALYISHYPLGRDATVDYPNIDLKFVNDTGHWLLLRTFVGSSSLVVGLYGTPQHRRVVSDAEPLRVVSPPKVEKTPDPNLLVGETAVDDEGVPAQSTSVRRRVYAPDGKLLSDATWSSYYRSEPKQVRVGTQKPEPATTTTTTTTTGTTTTPTTTAPEPPH
jgi:vancomycin resistance protein YoaR